MSALLRPRWRLGRRGTTFRWLHQQIAELTLAEMLGPPNLRRVSPEDYRVLREIYNSFERYTGLGNDIQLTQKERLASALIMREKGRKYQKGIMDPTKFTPGYHIFQVLPFIKKSPLFHMLQKMPKGAALKVHDTSMCSSKALIELTYRENLWVCTKHNGCHVSEFRFSKEKPKGRKGNGRGGEWMPMEKLRELRGDENLRKYLRVRFSMYPLGSFTTNAEAWYHLMGIFGLLEGLLEYAPVWADYFYKALEEFYADGVQYLEVRSVIPQLYCLDGSLLSKRDTVQIYKDTLERFKQEHPGFIDCKLIYAPLRHVQPEVVGEYVKECIALNKEFPTFVIGFDLVGQEDVGHPLSKFAEQLLKLPSHIKFFFHAGATNWYGSHVDQNLIDAIVLGTKRISNGYAITKHPVLMRLVKYLDIALEVCPVSNQVLQLGSDFRNHPAATLIAENVPLVISSGSPGLWGAAPLSHDIYMAFLGIAPLNSDLKFLKRNAKNSIKYSSLRDEGKAEALEKWKKMWNEWVENLLLENENQSKESEPKSGK